jgi:hypothetical protein
MAVINKLKPRTYYFNRQNPYHMTLDTFEHYGFIAQDVQRVVPCMVHTVITPPQVDSSRKIIAKSDTFKALDYNQITPLLAQGLQEHQQTIDSLRALAKAQQQKIDSLLTVGKAQQQFNDSVRGVMSCVYQLCPHQNNNHDPHRRGSGDDTTKTDVTLSDENAPFLFQNDPNPFGNGGTKINYFLPQNGVTSASMIFFDSYGRQIKEVPLTQTGDGVLNVTPENLSAGIYAYRLVVNGKVINTLKMVLQK